MNKGLYIVLGLFALGFCFDAAPLMDDIPIAWKLVAGGIMVFRMAAIAGVLSQMRWGWFTALGFCLLWMALRAITISSGHPLALAIGFMFPIICLVILIITKDDFSA